MYPANLGLDMINGVAAFDIHSPDVEVQCVNDMQRKLGLLWDTFLGCVMELLLSR